jgi:hypothetical protein
LIYEGDRTGLHGDASVLLIEPIVEKSQLSGLFFMYDAIIGNEAVCNSGLAMIDMSNDGYVPDSLCLGQQIEYLFESVILSDHSGKFV